MMLIGSPMLQLRRRSVASPTRVVGSKTAASVAPAALMLSIARCVTATGCLTRTLEPCQKGSPGQRCSACAHHSVPHCGWMPTVCARACGLCSYDHLPLYMLFRGQAEEDSFQV